MRPLRIVGSALGVLAVFTLGWLLTELVFWLTGRPPALVGYLIQVVISLVLGAAIARLAMLRSNPRDTLLTELRTALDRISQGDFAIRVPVREQSPFADVVSSVNRMAHNLGTLEQQRQEFVSNVSHEIQSPLTSIIGFTDLLGSAELDDATRQRYLGIIATECRRLSRLSDNLLRLSTLDDATPERTPLRLDERLGEVVLALEPQWSSKGVEVELLAESVTVEADADLLRQVWTNLIHNAVKFTPEGGRVRIRVTGAPDGAATVEVTDTGIGIAAADQARIFERFYRADRARGAGGNGLGLALARRIVGLHGGRLLVSSEPDHGATFTVHLPGLHAVDTDVMSG